MQYLYGKVDTKMNEVFEMVAEVLEELRSEAGEREYSVCTKEAKNAAKELKKANQEYEKLLAEISGEQRELLEKYMDIVDHAHFQEEQRAYYQGMIDLNLLERGADYKELKKDITACLKAEMTADAEANAAEYLKEFKVCEKLLMIGQRKNITDAAIVSDLIGADVDAFVAHFFQFAYAILPGWQYDDVKFYEDFAFAVLSQYSDLYEKYQLNILLDVADLYIKHGDFGHGDECYGYILRDNQIKDYIYYRFASVYEDIDFNKAKALAYESLQYVDGRYTYYQNIMDIINK